MPAVSVSIFRKRTKAQKQVVLNAVRNAVLTAFEMENKGYSIRLQQYEPCDFLLPPGKDRDFILVELSIFCGRTDSRKRALYRLISEYLEGAGENGKHVTVILHEPHMENWGIAGGYMAADYFNSSSNNLDNGSNNRDGGEGK